MIRIVADASIIGTVILYEEDSETVARLQDSLLGAELVVASHLALEVAAIIVKASRRRRIAPADRDLRLTDFERLLGAAPVQPAATARQMVDLAVATGLTAYDAVYLELAERLDATLATNDDALIAAARARGVAVLTTRP